MRIKCIVAYDGTNYFGWQSQDFVVSIQDTIQEALTIIHKHEVKICGSGRTDRGVHALGQVFHFDTELNISEDKWLKALNANLPSDIRIVSVEFVDDSFHARKSAKEKEYQYFINLGPYDLFKRNYITQINEKLDINKMKEATKIFIGTHDFSALCGNRFDETVNQVRTIYSLDIIEYEDILCFRFVGDGFLRYMVRMIMGLLIEIGKSKMTLSEAQTILESKSKESCRLKANPEGLYLVNVKF